MTGNNPFAQAAAAHHASKHGSTRTLAPAPAAANPFQKPTAQAPAPSTPAPTSLPFAPTLEQQAIIDGFSRGEDMVIMAGAGTGKALRNDQTVYTPQGPKPICEIVVGDTVLGSDGMPTLVTGVFPQGIRPLFVVTTCDGVEIVADEDHLWSVTINTHDRDMSDRLGSRTKSGTWTTSQIAELLDDGASVILPTLSAPAEFEAGLDDALPVLAAHEEAEGGTDKGFLQMANESVSDPSTLLYRHSSLRRKVLQWKLGGASEGMIRTEDFYSAEFYADLTRSLGGTAHLRTNSSGDVIVAAQLPAWDSRSGVYSGPMRRIVSIVPTEDDYATCIKVDAEDSLFLTEGFVLTHNTSTLTLLGETLFQNDPNARGFYVALNKSIADEVGSKFTRGNIDSSTIHSLAFRASRNIPHIAPLLGRIGANMKDNLPPWEYHKYFAVKDASFNYTSPEDKAAGIPDKPVLFQGRNLCSAAIRTIRKWCQTADKDIMVDHVPLDPGMPKHVYFDSEYRAKVVEIAKKIWDTDLTKPEGRVRFEHDFYMKAWALTEPDLITEFGLQGRRVVFFFDEAQDSKPCVSDIVFRQRGRIQLVFVGDASQAIYGFTGARDALSHFKNWDHVHSYRLTKTWRFGPSIAAAANAILDRLDGDVRIVPNHAVSSNLVPVNRGRGNDGPFSGPLYTGENIPTNVDAVITRSNAEIIRALMVYTDMGLRVYCHADTDYIIKIADDVELLRDGKKPKHQDMKAFPSYAEMVAYVEEKNGDPDALRSLLKIILNQGPAKVRSIVSKAVPSESSADIVLSTIHKAKGRQWSSVWIPSGPEAFLASHNTGLSHPRARKDALMLLYVALTRAIDKLYLDAELLYALGLDSERLAHGGSWYAESDAQRRLGPLFPSSPDYVLTSLDKLGMLDRGDEDMVNIVIGANRFRRAAQKVSSDWPENLRTNAAVIADLGLETVTEAMSHLDSGMPAQWVYTFLSGAASNETLTKALSRVADAQPGEDA